MSDVPRVRVLDALADGTNVPQVRIVNYVGPARADAWPAQGIWVASTPPSVPCTYAQWVAGAAGYWGWKEIP